MKYQSVAVPFVQVGDRRCLTELQLVESPELAAFVRRFPDSFERDIGRDVWWFLEPDEVPA